MRIAKRVRKWREAWKRDARILRSFSGPWAGLGRHYQSQRERALRQLAVSTGSVPYGDPQRPLLSFQLLSAQDAIQ